MADMKKQLSNVSFGGSWSEDILSKSETNAALDVLRWAASSCGECDVHGAELRAALEYVRMNVMKGEAMASAFSAALAIEDPEQREAASKDVYRRIKLWSGG